MAFGGLFALVLLATAARLGAFLMLAAIHSPVIVTIGAAILLVLAMVGRRVLLIVRRGRGRRAMPRAVARTMSRTGLMALVIG